MVTAELLKKIEHLEKELKDIKMLIQKESPLSKKSVLKKIWKSLNIFDKDLDSVKGAIFDFDIEKYVAEEDVKAWK